MTDSWPIDVAANAASTTPRTIRRWIDHGVIALRAGDHKPARRGHPCRLSRQRVYQVAITYQLLQVGMTLSQAAKAAFAFTDNGNPGRDPACLFEFGKTLLIIVPKEALVINADYDASFAELTGRIARSAAIVDLNRIVAQVDQHLTKE